MRQLLLLSLLLFAGCYQPPRLPPKTQLQIRELQTRNYTARDQKQVMKAVIAALQDDGFIIRNADRELGFINASKEFDSSDPRFQLWYQLFSGPDMVYQKNTIVEASANVSEFGPEVRVRIVFQIKVMDNFGRPMETRTVEDGLYYQEFFSKVDKSLFFEKSGI
jgi:hypothetical protein